MHTGHLDVDATCCVMHLTWSETTGHTTQYSWNVLRTKEVATCGGCRLCRNCRGSFAHPAMQREDICGRRFSLWLCVNAALGRRFGMNSNLRPRILCQRVGTLISTHRDGRHTSSDRRAQTTIILCRSSPQMRGDGGQRWRMVLKKLFYGLIHRFLYLYDLFGLSKS